MRRKARELRIPALEVQQGPRRRLYVFAVDGKEVPRFASVSRIKRNGKDVAGYQRPEVLAHIGEIRGYLESEDPMIPNAVVLAFDKRVRFESHFGPTGSYSRPGEFVIPIDDSWNEEQKPGFIVDGQQRLAAIRDAEIERFPMCVSAFITDDLKQQTEQFILVNSTKPLPKGLIYELLPNTQARLPTTLGKKRFPAELLARLNLEKDSPLEGMIQTPTTPGGIIKDNSILRMLENSLSEGVLYRYRDDERNDTQPMFELLCAYWGAVKDVFKNAWGKPPKKSRLMHGAGILSMGYVMDAIGDRHRNSKRLTQHLFSEDLQPLREICRWTDGYWNFGPGRQRKWNELQNTSRDIQLLANHLLVHYKARVWNTTYQA
jgi:DGQHR domain-containing protein